MGSDDSAGLYYPVGAKARRTFQVDQEKGEIVQEKTESADATLHWDTLCDLPQKSSAISNSGDSQDG